jgi:hypothetical protein
MKVGQETFKRQLIARTIFLLQKHLNSVALLVQFFYISHFEACLLWS